MTQQRYNNSKNIKYSALTNVENLDKIHFWKNIRLKKWEVDKMDEGGQKAQTSCYKINHWRWNNVQHGDYG